MCALTRQVRPEAELIRFVAAPDGTVVPDLKAKLPGRGVWVGLGRAEVKEAIRRNVFARGLKVQAKPVAELADQVAGLLRSAALGRLGLARKAGAAIAGFAKVEAAVERQPLAALVIASDAAEDGRRKMEQALWRRYGQEAPVPVLRLFSGAELGLAMGRPDVIHAAVLQGPAGKSFVDAAVRLQRYEGAGGGLVTDTADDPQGMANE
jgi:predicted RNA-binding protein YlxR (DUF448 family)